MGKSGCRSYVETNDGIKHKHTMCWDCSRISCIHHFGLDATNSRYFVFFLPPSSSFKAKMRMYLCAHLSSFLLPMLMMCFCPRLFSLLAFQWCVCLCVSLGVHVYLIVFLALAYSRKKGTWCIRDILSLLLHRTRSISIFRFISILM